MMLNAEVAAVLAEDAATLALLHERELSAPMLTELMHLGFPYNLALSPIGDASRESYKAMRQALVSLPLEPGAGLLDDLAADYASIYLTGALGASPCESYWLSDDHLVCQESMFDVRAVYAAAGLAVPDWRKRPDDHLVFQLQFLARRLAAADDRDAWCELGDFLDRHLLRWLPDFAARVAGRCDTPLYAALALLTDAWCRQLRSLIVQFLGEAQSSPEEHCDVPKQTYSPSGDIRRSGRESGRRYRGSED